MVWEPQKFLTFELGNTFKLQRITCFFIEPLIRRIPAKPTIITVTLEGEAGRASQRFPKNLSQGMGPSQPHLSRTWFPESLQTVKCQHRSSTRDAWVTPGTWQRGSAFLPAPPTALSKPVHCCFAWMKRIFHICSGRLQISSSRLDF